MDVDEILDAALIEDDDFGVKPGLIELEDNDMCYIDEETSRTLELVQNSTDSSNRKHSLMGYLNVHFQTTSGTRMLRELILKPLCHSETLEQRLDCIQYLVERVDVLCMVGNSIKHFGSNVDLDHVVPVLQNLFKSRTSSLHIAEKRLEALTTLEDLVTHVDSLVESLAATDEPTLNIYRGALKDPSFAKILDEIHNVIESDGANHRGKRSKVFRIRHGVEPLFDITRSTYIAAINDLEQYVRELQREDGIAWKLSYGETRGYYLTLAADQLPKNTNLPKRYIRVNKTRTMISCTTTDMMQSNVRANLSYENSMNLANEVLQNTISSVINHLDSINRLVSIVGSLDLITSFAKLINNSNGSLVRPKFTATETIIIKGRHPVLESVLSVNNATVTPNDAVFCTGHKNFMLVTGPNMGGKSIFLKQVAVIQVMAQIGCYVPAESAHIKLMNRIVARSGSTEDSESSCSSFMWEMKGIASALNRDDFPDSQSALFVIDEVGRGTTIDDGASYSAAIAEDLALRRYSFTIFATHFDQVFALTSLYGNIQAYHFKYYEDEDGRLKITHSLIPGFCEKYHYGIKLAEAIGLPEEILTAARRGVDLTS